MASHYQITPITPTWHCEASNQRATSPGPKSEIIIKRVTITNLERNKHYQVIQTEDASQMMHPLNYNSPAELSAQYDN